MRSASGGLVVAAAGGGFSLSRVGLAEQRRLQESHRQDVLAVRMLA
jgi:hypothetical protein